MDLSAPKESFSMSFAGFFSLFKWETTEPRYTSKSFLWLLPAITAPSARSPYFEIKLCVRKEP